MPNCAYYGYVLLIPTKKPFSFVQKDSLETL